MNPSATEIVRPGASYVEGETKWFPESLVKVFE